MRKLLHAVRRGVTVLLLLQSAALAQVPKVPLTYPGDSDVSISRRAKWMEGARAEGSLVWWGTVAPVYANTLISEFNKFYPFIKVTYWRSTGKEIASKMEAENLAGVNSVDVLLGGEPVNIPRWRKMGLLAKFTDLIPGVAKMNKNVYSKYGDAAVPGNNAATPQYNTNLVSAAEAPKNWNDLLNPKWKGKGNLAVAEDVKAWYTLALGEGGWGIEKTEDFLRKLVAQDVIWTRGHDAGHNLMVAGEFKVFAEAFTWEAYQLQEKGAPVAWVKTNPVVISGAQILLMNKAPHPNAGKLFLEWLLSPRGLALFEKVTFKGLPYPGSGTRLAKDLEGSDLVVETEEVQIKAAETGLAERFYKIMGMTK